MIARFDNVTLKIWFSNQSISRNIHNVYEMEYNDNIGAEDFYTIVQNILGAGSDE